MAEETAKVTITPEFFGPLYQYIEDDSITDIDFDGRKLWLSNTSNERYSPEVQLPADFVNAFAKRVANCVSKQFHKQSPVLEAETDTLRITIVHESAAISGRAICIRKSMPFTRLTREGMTSDGYLSDDMISLLINCVRSKMNMVFCGEPGVGKTECAKFFSQYIPKSQRVITIEDNPEWHYAALNPGSDCVELRINPVMDYTKAIKTCLRLNPKWMMLSEARSKEVVYLMEGFSTGVRGMTTLHTDDVRKVPDRMLNMAGNLRSEGRLENDIYSFIDVAVLIRRKLMTRPDGSSGLMRYVDQIGFFYRKDRDNRCILMLDGGEKTGEKFPDVIQKKFDEAHIGDPYVYEEKEPAVVRQSASYQKTEVPQSTGMVAEGRGSYGNRPEDMDRAFQEKMMKGMTFIGKKRKQG
ncbi:MAG: ATPase, T2SS/T4P/T4SS family [Lachnospiraceae bacterium]|nr:CpaF/VirB11 family protein [Lachnospiraceae bacterium]MDD7326359.1 ATPase, T2SS/T4P/T4SS family [Lachnospiraceae bacterium]MDY2759818.1 ATPase, T2SS/T4P/T4SS family [Lachnospiraceae bacterium]